MTVGELLSRLGTCDRNAVGLFMDEHSDASDATEIQEVVVPAVSWMCERHATVAGNVDFHHPTANGLSLGWDEAACTRWEEVVVVLSTSPTNLCFSR